jgi:hypothetical protein
MAFQETGDMRPLRDHARAEAMPLYYTQNPEILAWWKHKADKCSREWHPSA